MKYYFWSGLSSDTKDTTQVGVGALALESDTGDEYRWTGTEWQKVGAAGSSHAKLVSIASLDLAHAQVDQYIALLGSPTTYAALPSGAGKGPDVYSVDLADFGSSDIYLVTLYTTGTIAGTVTVKYSQGSLSARLLHPETADTLISAVAGNNQVLVPKKDGFAHFTITQGAGTAETMWIYLVGRNQS